MRTRIPNPRASAVRALTLLAVLALAVTADAVQSGQKSPAVAGARLDGQGQLSLAELKGKVVYLDFWASWCKPCALSLPALDAFRKEFPSKDFAVLAVNVDRDPALAKAFLSRRPVGYPSVFDAKGELPVRFGVETMPTSFLIDRDGVIRRVHRGFRKEDVPELRSAIQELIRSGR
ncbi:MAG TPA: TlpA disulfide reductase family protein [Myxococcota bacterium]|jgi:thiol-disulfide isomerase/thioredoxin|nr:TlpA disulfide reductase family protein [Myxococcota bacterium]